MVRTGALVFALAATFASGGAAMAQTYGNVDPAFADTSDPNSVPIYAQGGWGGPYAAGGWGGPYAAGWGGGPWGHSRPLRRAAIRGAYYNSYAAGGGPYAGGGWGGPFGGWGGGPYAAGGWGGGPFAAGGWGGGPFAAGGWGGGPFAAGGWGGGPYAAGGWGGYGYGPARRVARRAVRNGTYAAAAAANDPAFANTSDPGSAGWGWGAGWGGGPSNAYASGAPPRAPARRAARAARAEAAKPDPAIAAQRESATFMRDAFMPWAAPPPK
jgi:hypothetical protein